MSAPVCTRFSVWRRLRSQTPAKSSMTEGYGGTTMRMKTSVLWLVLLVPWLLLRGHGLADQRPGPHTHEGQTHKHDTWEKPPAAYAKARSTRWGDPAAAARGEPLFQTHCMVCHGTDGKGRGPGAAGLPHAPADLTHHFHRASGDGDAYLFWRVSEGGQVEPFTSMQSTMPAFKTVLTEDQRWDVLAYVHATFHSIRRPRPSPRLAASGHTPPRRLTQHAPLPIRSRRAPYYQSLVHGGC